MIDQNEIIEARHQDEIINSTEFVDKFLVIDEHRKNEKEILKRWKNYFDEYNIPYVITRESWLGKKKGEDVEYHRNILWKNMPYTSHKK